ncbi:hypothetical protein MA16_Dca011109 [Dendrobium catenatum]|uniref:Uncharacterized protein n=1 Tax=Dendrobium catenatum TaxID=906689 RepID=A0A2I0WSA2_9ASPA|nr:hypothetical protein MA16_Dca011109 [Dendrobium catenatum]
MASSVDLQEAFDVIGVARLKLFGGGMKTGGHGKQPQVVELDGEKEEGEISAGWLKEALEFQVQASVVDESLGVEVCLGIL